MNNPSQSGSRYIEQTSLSQSAHLSPQGMGLKVCPSHPTNKILKNVTSTQGLRIVVHTYNPSTKEAEAAKPVNSRQFQHS